MRSIAPGPDAYAWRSGTSGKVSDRRARADGAAMKVDRAISADRRSDLLVAGIAYDIVSGQRKVMIAQAATAARVRAAQRAIGGSRGRWAPALLSGFGYPSGRGRPKVRAWPTSTSPSWYRGAPASEIFQLLTDPGRHRDPGGSGTVRGVVSGTAISGVGDVFVMKMACDEDWCRILSVMAHGHLMLAAISGRQGHSGRGWSCQPRE